MAKFSGNIFLIVGFSLTYLAANGEKCGLSAIIVNDQRFSSGYYRTVNVKNWVTSGVPGLFKNGEFTDSENSTFRITSPGSYYVAASIVVAVRRSTWYWYYYYRNTITAKLYLQKGGSYRSSQPVRANAFLTGRLSEKVIIKLSGYFRAEAGWQARIRVHYSGRSITIKPGSSFSLIYTSKSFAFPGGRFSGRYQAIHIQPPNYSSKIMEWYKVSSDVMSVTSSGDFVVPAQGLYHVSANIVVRRRTDIEFTFSVIVNGTINAVSKTTKLKSEGRTTITLECIVKLSKQQHVSVLVSSNKARGNLTFLWGSSIFISFKGKVTKSVSAISATFIPSSDRLPANTWNSLLNWKLKEEPSFNFGNIEPRSGQFFVPKSGIYFVLVAIVTTTSNCSQVWAKLNLNQLNVTKIHSIGPGFDFVPENEECHLDVSLLIQMSKGDSLQISVKSDKALTVETSLQILSYGELYIWPATQITLKNAFSFSTTKQAVKVNQWSPSKINVNEAFFTVNSDNIKITTSGLYVVSCSIIVQGPSKFQFQTQLTVNGEPMDSDSKCLRNKTPETFTCTTFSLLNLFENDYISVFVKANNKSRLQNARHFRSSSNMSVILIGDTRSYPAFKLKVKDGSESHIAGVKSTKLSSFSLLDSSNKFFQNAALYSKLIDNSGSFGFTGGPENTFFVFSTMQFKMLNNGGISSLVGSRKQNGHVYSWDNTTGVTSVVASAIVFNESFSFNVSSRAYNSDFRWRIEPGSVVSAISIWHKRSPTVFRVMIERKKRPSISCSSKWTGFSNWMESMEMNNLGTIGDQRLEILHGGLYYMFLNFAMKSNTSNTVVELGLFVDDEVVLFSKESSPEISTFFSIPLQGLVVLNSQQIVDVRIKCSRPSDVTCSNEIALNAFLINVDTVNPGFHWKVHFQNYYNRKSMHLHHNPSQLDSQSYTMNAVYNQSTNTMVVSRTGVYFFSLIGSTTSTGNIHLAFLSNANSPTCSKTFLFNYVDSSYSKKSVSISGFVLLQESRNFELKDVSNNGDYYSHYHYVSLHYMGDLQMSSGLTAKLSRDKSLKQGVDNELREKLWVTGSSCGEFKTEHSPEKFGRYKASYYGLYIVTFNLVIRYAPNCHVSACFVINGRYLREFAKQSCFERYMNGTSFQETTLGGSELLHLNDGEEVSIQVNNTCEITISKNSSLSVFYLGTKGVLLGFTSIIATPVAKLRTLIKSRSYIYPYGIYHDDGSTDYEVQGWSTDMKNSKMYFKRIPSSPLDKMFVCPKTGVYLILVKLHVRSTNQLYTQDKCVVGVRLAIDSLSSDFIIEETFVNKARTLSFTTTILLRKWQGLTVRFSKANQCGKMDVEEGSSFAAIYLASGNIAHSWAPDIGPHIVEVPPSSVSCRKDKKESFKLTCRAVGKFGLKYQWINSNKEVVGVTDVVDASGLNVSQSNRVMCVVTMGELVTKSSYITLTIFDPTPEFIETYSNETYDLVETNTTQDRYTSVLVGTFGVRVKLQKRWSYFVPIECFITRGNHNNTFFISRHYRSFYWNSLKIFSLRARNIVDRETIPEYHLNITCTNTAYKDASNATTTLHVVILDVNDNLPVFEEPIYNVTIPKNRRPGEDVIQVQANDDDFAQNGKISYRLVYTSDSYIFVIDKQSGLISLSTREVLAKPSYVLTVEATDQGRPPRSSYVTVIINVHGFIHNRTNFHPVFEEAKYKALLINIAPIGTIVTIVRAYDPDNGEDKHILYSIYSGDDSVFEIDSRSGVIRTKEELSIKTYDLEIAAEYSDKPRTSSEEENRMNITVVQITVQNVDRTMVSFLKPHYKATVKENAKVDTKVLEVLAVDPLKRKKSHLEYTIPNRNAPFHINPLTGEISIGAKLDYETTKRHVFVVRVSEVPNNTRSSCTDVTIEVEDVNDNAPIILRWPKEIKLKQDTPIGTSMGTIVATDADQGRNGKIKYYLTEDYNVFRIDHETGEIFTKRFPDCCDVLYPALKVEVKDEGNPPLKTFVEIYIVYRPGRGKKEGSSHKKIIIIASVCGAIVILVGIIVVVFWRRRQISTRNHAVMNYIYVPSSDDDDELLDDADGEENNDNGNNDGRRLNLISGSQECLLPNEVAC